MLYQINTPEKLYRFEASSLTTACVVTTLLGGGFYSLWQDGKQVMPVFMSGGAEDWFKRVFDKNFTDLVQEVSPDEISRIYMLILAGQPREPQRYFQELFMLHHSKGTLLNAAKQWRPNYKPTRYGSWMIPGAEVVQLLDGRELPIQEILGEVGTNLWLVDLGEIPAYAITPGENGRWVEVETVVV
jgi:hypothetical protein